MNLVRYRNPRIDSLLDRADVESNPASRSEMLVEAERTALQDNPIIPLYFYASSHLVKTEISGWYSNVMNVIYSKDLSIQELSRH